MPHLVPHGGHCCGINHIISFGSFPSPAYLKSLDASIKQRKPIREKGLLEAVLTDSQLCAASQEGVTWHEELLKRGFVRVARFYNSGNSVCNVYHLIHGQENLIGKKTDPVNKIAAKKEEKPKEVSSPFVKQAPETQASRQRGFVHGGIDASPRALRVAHERGVSLVGVRGSGPNGRILVRDVPNG